MSAPAIISSGTAAGGPPVGGTGTSSPSTIPRWTGPSTLGDSGLIDNGTAIYTTARDRFGIGIATPDQGLHVLSPNNATTSGGQVTQQNFNGVSNQKWMTSVGGGDNVWVNGRGWFLRDMTAGATRIVCDTSGNVGIGTASPGYRLDVAGTTGTGFVAARFKSEYATAALVATDSSTVWFGLGAIGNTNCFQVGTNFLNFRTNGADAARIDSNGNLVVGLAANASTSTNRLQLANNSTAKQGIEFRPGVAIGGGTGNEIVNYDRNLGAYLGTEWSSSFFRLSLSGSYFEASTSGAGVKLPATPGNTDPNTLDCYADGGTAGGGGKTWTPADTSGAGLTLTINSAQYIQVGKLVVMTADITYPVTASAAVASLSLPVSPAVNYFHAGSTGYQTTPAIAGLAPMVKNTAMNMWAYDTQQTNVQLSGKRLIFTVSYFMG